VDKHSTPNNPFLRGTTATLTIKNAAQIGGPACVLQNVSTTQCDALGKLAGIRPVAEGPASPERHGARFGGVRMGSAAQPKTGESRHPAWRARVPGLGLLPAPTGTRRGLLPDHVRRSAGPEFGSDAASRGYLGPIN
jgi:hypothetical protein